jgi:hypothetical protein
MAKNTKKWRLSALIYGLSVPSLLIVFVCCGQLIQEAGTISQKDNRVILSAGSPGSVDADATTASVTFTGATGLSLGVSDFKVTGEATIGNPVVSGDTVTVPLTFAANYMTGPKIYVVSIPGTNAAIRGSGSVTVTQSGLGSMWTILTAGPSVSAPRLHSLNYPTNVTFTGAAGLSLGASDFKVTGAEGATIGNPVVSGDTVTVPVKFNTNETGAQRTLVVSVSEASTIIKGSTSVTITQDGPSVETKVLLTAGPDVSKHFATVRVYVYFYGATKLSAAVKQYLSNTDFTINGHTHIERPYIDPYDPDRLVVPLYFFDSRSRWEFPYTVRVSSRYFYCPDPVTITVYGAP